MNNFVFLVQLFISYPYQSEYYTKTVQNKLNFLHLVQVNKADLDPRAAWGALKLSVLIQAWLVEITTDSVYFL